MSRRRALALAASAMVAAALVPLGSATIAPASAGAAPRVTCAQAAASNDVTVAFVIDFSGAAGAPGSGIVRACVAVPSGDNDSEALAAVATEEGFPIPRYNNSGLLCAIGGIPARGCGQNVGGGYAYWAYWQGSPSGWNYANTGPAGNQVNSSVVQGWRWEDPGRANPTDPQPRGPTTPGPICNPGPPPTTTTTAAPTTTPPPPGSTRVPTTGGRTSRNAVVIPATSTAPAAARQSTEPPASRSARPAGQAAPTTAARARKHGTTTSTTAVPTTQGGLAPVAAGLANGRLPSSHPGSASHGGGGTPWLVIGLVVLVVGALGGVAAYRWRRTPLP